MSSNEKFDREFEDFLNEENSRVAALYRKLPRPEPDARLDAAVQAMARRAQAAAPRMRSHSPRWLPALSAAAIVLLAAGIAFRIGPTVWQERKSGSAQKPVADKALSAPASAADTAAETQRSADAFKDQIAAKPAPASAPPATPQAANAAPVARAPSRQLELAPKRDDARAPQAFPSQKQELEKKSAEVGGAADVNGVARPQVKGELDEQASDRERAQPMQTAPEEPALKLRESAPAPRPAPVDAAPSGLSSAPTAQASAAGGSATEPTSAAPVPAAKAATAPARSKDPNARLYPEHWLANIRTMLRQNKRDEAVRSLTEFRKMYPDYHLPEDLRDLK